MNGKHKEHKRTPEGHLSWKLIYPKVLELGGIWGNPEFLLLLCDLGQDPLPLWASVFSPVNEGIRLSEHDPQSPKGSREHPRLLWARVGARVRKLQPQYLCFYLSFKIE